MRRFLAAVLIVCLVFAAAAGLLLWRLSLGPLSLAWVQAPLMEMVRCGSPFDVAFDRPSLVWDRRAGLIGLQLEDVVVHDDTGGLIASVPQIRGAIAVRPLLAERRIELAAVRATLPEIGLERDADGRLGLKFDGKPVAVPLGQTSGEGGLGALLGDADGSKDPRLAGLRRIQVEAPVLQYLDLHSGRRTVANDAVLTLVRPDELWEASLAARIGDGHVTASGKAIEGSTQQAIRVDIDGLRLRAFKAFAPELPVEDLDLPVSGSISFPVEPATGERGAAIVDLTAAGGQVAAPEIGLAPVTILGAGLRGKLDAGWLSGQIDELRVAGDSYSLTASGSVGLANDDVEADVALTCDNVDIAVLLRLWPTKLAPEARTWIVQHVSAGRLGNAAFQTGHDGARPGQGGMTGSLAFADAAVLYMDGFPTATGLTGTARFVGDSLTVSVGGGRTGEIELGRSSITLSNLSGAGVTRLEAKLDLRSTLPAAMRLLDAEPIALGRYTGLSPDRAGGRQATTATVGLPLIDPLPPARITYNADVRLTNFELREISPGYSLAGDGLNVNARQSGIRAAGDVRVNTVPVNVDFRSQTAPADGVRQRITARASLDQAAVQRLGYTWPAQLGGTVGVNANLSEGLSPIRQAAVTLDLRNATVTVPELSLAKVRGEPGNLDVSLRQRSQTDVTVDSVALTLPGWTVAASGALRLEPLRPQRITVSRLRSPLGDLTGDVTMVRDVWTGRVDIGSFDARPFMQGGGSGSDAAVMPDFALQVAARSLRLGETPLSNLSGSVDRRNGQFRAARLQAGIQGSTLSLDLTNGPSGGSLNIRGSDAGWVIRSVTDSDHGVRGGRLTLTAQLPPSTGGLVANGDLKIRDFTMWGAPTIARIVSLASFSGIANAMSGRGIPVSRIVAPFSLRNDVVTLNMARLVAADIGARIDGRIDLNRQAFDLNGTVAPAYTINRMLGRIPILGNLLSGSRSDALFAASFTITGPFGNPRVSVNPLTALVPGVIRDLFGGFDTDPASRAE